MINEIVNFIGISLRTMPISLTAIALKASKFGLEQLMSIAQEEGKTKLKTLLSSKYNEYQGELYEIINRAMHAYQAKHPGVKEEGVYFFQSQALIDELLKFRLDRKVDKEAILKGIENDDRIELPTNEQIDEFLGIFDDELGKSKSLDELFVDNNYKAKIFSLHETLDVCRIEIQSISSEFNKLRSDLQSISPLLQAEWSRQLDEIQGLLFRFRPKTALDLLLALEKRISESGGLQNTVLLARIIYLKAYCHNEIGGENKDTRVALYKTAFKISPHNITYKQSATVICYDEGEFEEAERLAEDLLVYDPLNVYGWVVRCLLNKDNFPAFYKKVPKPLQSNTIFLTKLIQLIYQSKVIISFTDIDKLGIDVNIAGIQPPSEITIENRNYWIFIGLYLFGKFQEDLRTERFTSFLDEQEKSEKLVLSNKILGELTKALINTEISYLFPEIFFSYSYTQLLLTGDPAFVSEMSSNYDAIEKKAPFHVMVMSRSLASLGTKDSIQKAIVVLEDTAKLSDNKMLMKASYHLMLGDRAAAFEVMNEFIDSKAILQEPDVFNILQFVVVLAQPMDNQQFNEKLLDVIEHKSFAAPHLKQLFVVNLNYLQTPKLDKGKVQENLLEITSKEANDSLLNYFIATGYLLNDLVDEAIAFLEDYVHKDRPSPDLKLLCKAIFDSRTAPKLELIPILEKWRENFHFDPEIVAIELYLKQTQGKWAEAVEIAEFAYEHLPSERFLSEVFFSAFRNNVDTEKIKLYAENLRATSIKSEEIAIRIANIVLRAGFPLLSIEILYKCAKQRGNIHAREAFLSASVLYPPTVMVTYDSVVVGSFVTYVLNGEKNMVEITEENKNTLPYASFLGKKANEIVSITQAVSGKILNATIVRAVNKYLGLLDEILIDIEDPMRGYSVIQMKIQGDTAESITKTMVEELGAMGTLQFDQSNATLEKYYNGEISFGEVGYSVFRGDFFDTYFALTGGSPAFFRAIPTFWSQMPVGEKHFVLDVTTVCLFYELSGKGISFNRKFIVPNSLVDTLNRKIESLQHDPPSNLSITVLKDGIIPHFREEGFTENLIRLYHGVKEWIQINCEVTMVEERVNLASRRDTDIFDQGLSSIHIDCRLIVDRPNHCLISNDLFFAGLLNVGRQQMISPETFLSGTSHSEDFKVYQRHFIDKQYVGITITAELLKEEYYKFLAGQKNHYTICLKNLQYYWNPSLNNLIAAVLFLKELFLGSVIVNESKLQTARSIFTSLVNGMSASDALVLKKEIEKEFALMGVTKEEILIELLFVLKARNST